MGEGLYANLCELLKMAENDHLLLLQKSVETRREA